MRRFQTQRPIFTLGILCSIQLSYADLIFAALSNGLPVARQVPEGLNLGRERGSGFLAHRFPNNLVPQR
jgi:hypothetical protein